MDAFLATRDADPRVTERVWVHRRDYVGLAELTGCSPVTLDRKLARAPRFALSRLRTPAARAM